jgi:hypothetical protein
VEGGAAKSSALTTVVALLQNNASTAATASTRLLFPFPFLLPLLSLLSARTLPYERNDREELHDHINSSQLVFDSLTWWKLFH